MKKIYYLTKKDFEEIGCKNVIECDVPFSIIGCNTILMAVLYNFNSLDEFKTKLNDNITMNGVVMIGKFDLDLIKDFELVDKKDADILITRIFEKE